MSDNQSRTNISNSVHYRKKGRSSGFSQRNTGKGGAAASSPPSLNTQPNQRVDISAPMATADTFNTGKGGGAASSPPSSNFQPNRSFSEKSNHAQGGQSGASGYRMICNTDPNSVPANQPAPAPSAQVTDTVVKQTADQPAQRRAQVVQKAPSSQAAYVEPDRAPQATPAKAPGDASKSFPIQFGSVGPDTLNGMQGMMYQDGCINLRTHKSPQMPPQLGNMGMGADNNFKTRSKSAPSTCLEDSFDNFRKDNSLISSTPIVPDAYESALSVKTLTWNRPVKTFTGFHKSLYFSPTTPAPVMHKAQKKYQIGKISNVEEVKRRQLKAILNKLIPQNYGKLFEQVIAINIDSAGILVDFVSQIFDKALMEPMFCDMYANLCYDISGALPDFTEDDKKINFKRLLLNKCQEEFERWEREQEEANRADVEGELKQCHAERVEKGIQTRQRMFGNIRLIGELYKKRMLTERVMHECIKKLLDQYQNPVEEDIEALCILMSIIGEMIDHPKAKEHMDAYFDMMSKLSNNMKLSPRVRFMLKDANDLRKNQWQQRRIMSGPVQLMGSYGGMQRIKSDADRWQCAASFRKGLVWSPTPVPLMHKAQKKYQVGKLSDGEESKRRQPKSILHKLILQYFEKLLRQVKALNIDNVGTLCGVVSLIYEKALTEPSLCEMYVNLCYHLAGELPDFTENNEKITFKRLLLNMCQEEFERGLRENEEAGRADVEGEVEQSPEEREGKRIQMRKRMSGNIRLIGEMYKKRMLRERIMHECIKKLLGQYQNPDEEEIEALCILMCIIGEMIDHPKAKERMDAYFDMMLRLSNNMKLSPRVRFMLKDAIDLRKNQWQQRRKFEGPKNIDEVHMEDQS